MLAKRQIGARSAKIEAVTEATGTAVLAVASIAAIIRGLNEEGENTDVFSPLLVVMTRG